jgi:hypothetical protein
MKKYFFRVLHIVFTVLSISLASRNNHTHDFDNRILENSVCPDTGI